MSKLTRLTLITHALTDAVAAARFPADEPINELGRRALTKVGRPHLVDRADLVLTGSEARTRATAAALGAAATPESALADLNYGAWAGRSMDALPPADLTAWLTDPGHRPPGGESLTDLLARVSAWLPTLTATPRRIAAVTHPAVVRAVILLALDAPPKSFWRMDIAPLSATTLHGRSTSWTLRATAHPLSS
ncbi:histidine phosphatase family protein [Nocardia sp. CDC159]|uniref:Histidine phosphatase family protein n=1 Tax=Nocardia pulmonis TaxID=2951408 RepID=A0A9X2E3A1_9NOCA|nr:MULTISPECIES: histidine phosphatase family protein [Nocardia]MCM6772308.1 histidine phosphatase family protein [Nocardia pulmonis]MCM6785034.1 histidine phosphatase family protein [Nocardia sp. CDC159]